MFIQSESTSEWESHSDEELWMVFASGNRQAFSILFMRFYEKLFRYGVSLYPCEETVKDSIQHSFLRLWKKRHTLQAPESVSSYLYVSLRRLLFRNKKRQAARDRRDTEFIQRSLSHVLDTEHKLMLREQRETQKELLQKGIKSLTPRQKEALLLRLDSGLSNREIAGIMEISNKRVRNLICEATKRLKKHIYKSSN